MRYRWAATFEPEIVSFGLGYGQAFRNNCDHRRKIHAAIAGQYGLDRARLDDAEIQQLDEISGIAGVVLRMDAGVSGPNPSQTSGTGCRRSPTQTQLR